MHVRHTNTVLNPNRFPRVKRTPSSETKSIHWCYPVELWDRKISANSSRLFLLMYKCTPFAPSSTFKTYLHFVRFSVLSLRLPVHVISPFRFACGFITRRPPSDDPNSRTFFTWYRYSPIKKKKQLATNEYFKLATRLLLSKNKMPTVKKWSIFQFGDLHLFPPVEVDWTTERVLRCNEFDSFPTIFLLSNDFFFFFSLLFCLLRR